MRALSGGRHETISQRRRKGRRSCSSSQRRRCCETQVNAPAETRHICAAVRSAEMLGAEHRRLVRCLVT
jgi:hypothetical protein